MNLLNYGEYKFTYFDKIHIYSMVFFLILGILLLILPYFISERKRRIFEIFFGYMVILLKIFDSIYRISVEKYSAYETLPLHLCNLSLIVGGIYLITRKRIFFNIVYFWFVGAILAILLPGIKFYKTGLYVFIFMSTHFVEILIVIYGFVHNNEMITLKGLKVSIAGFLFFVVISYIVNLKYGTNYMYIQDYVIPTFSRIKIEVYRILLILVMILIMILMYLPFRKKTIGDINIERIS